MQPSPWVKRTVSTRSRGALCAGGDVPTVDTQLHL